MTWMLEPDVDGTPMVWQMPGMDGMLLPPGQPR